VAAGLLLSGGLDSTALANWLRPEIALTIDYGQLPARGEIRAARRIAQELGVDHEVITIDCRQLGSGDLAGSVPNRIAPVPEWWPFRNQLLLTIAAMRAISLGIDQLLFGSVASDSQHTDGGPEFFRVMDQLTRLQEGGVRVQAPAIGLTSLELIRTSGVDSSVLAWAHSCHTAEFGCGNCRGCYKRDSVLAQLEDYVAK
jgi:7-cyano-7-deazaguanine synthase